MSRRVSKEKARAIWEIHGIKDEQTTESEESGNEGQAGSAKETKEYTFFNPKVKHAAYATGDIYSHEAVTQGAQEWEINSKERPYLAHVKSLSRTWPHLRVLADFMEISTSPMRWRDFKVEERNFTYQDQRSERASRTNVTRLDYAASAQVVSQTYKTPQDLRKGLEETCSIDLERPSTRNFRLYIVEDLSRDVIELLGASLDIEPAFFRDQILDYAWYNVRDRWVNPPRLDVAIKRQRWIQLRFVTSRYFKSAASFKKGCQQAESFNVLRKLEDDINNKAIWDDQGGVVGLSRARASLWLNSKDDLKATVGVLLVDPTIKEGFPLWYDYLNWADTPGMHEKKPPNGPPRTSLYDDLVYWAENWKLFSSPSTTGPASIIDSPLDGLLRVVCSEWLTLSEYLKARLSQIEWEITFPQHFLSEGISIDNALKKLHIWRRLVPLYREMVTESLQRVFQVPCHALKLPNSRAGWENTSREDGEVTNYRSLSPLHDSPSVSAMREDFVRMLSYLEEYDQRIHRLTSVVTAVIAMQDSQRAREQSMSIAGRFTLLAVLFIPLSFIASLFSMTDDIGELRGTMKWYFISCSAFFVLCLLAAFATRYFRSLKFKWF